MPDHLWQFPFVAQAWGNAADWVGALGTAGAAITAAWFYVHNLHREEIAQARHISFDEDHHSFKDDKFYTQVNNFSDESIFDVTPSHTKKLTFREVLADECSPTERMTPGEVADLRELWESSGDTFYPTSLESGHVKPGESKKITFEGMRNPAQHYSISFRDAMARRWELDLNSGEPRRIRDEDELCPWWHIFLHPRCMIGKRREWAEFNRWMDHAVESSEFEPEAATDSDLATRDRTEDKAPPAQ